MVSQTALRNSAAANRLASWAVEHALRCRHRRDPRAGFVPGLSAPPRCARFVPRDEQQRLQHLHVVLDAMIELVQQDPLLRSACFRSLISTSMLIAPTILPGIAQRRRERNEGTRVPSGRSATASAPRTARPSLRATAIGHWSCGKRRAVRPIKFPGDAPFVAAERGRPAGESTAAWLK